MVDVPSADEIFRRSVQEKPSGLNGAMPGAGNALVLNLATVAESGDYQLFPASGFDYDPRTLQSWPRHLP